VQALLSSHAVESQTLRPALRHATPLASPRQTEPSVQVKYLQASGAAPRGRRTTSNRRKTTSGRTLAVQQALKRKDYDSDKNHSPT
jgi:hypothetical protein